MDKPSLNGYGGNILGGKMSKFGSRLEEDFAISVFGEILNAISDWMVDNLAPEDVFTAEQLEDWAEENGFTRIN